MIVRISNDAANAAGSVHGRGIGAALDKAIIVVAHNTAHIISSADVGIHNRYVVQNSLTGIAEQANTVFIRIDVQTGNGLAVAHKGAPIPISRIANGHPRPEIAAVPVQGTVCFQDIFIDHNIRHQLSVDGRTAPIDLRCKPIQMVGRIDLIIAIHQLRRICRICLPHRPLNCKHIGRQHGQNHAHGQNQTQKSLSVHIATS